VNTFIKRVYKGIKEEKSYVKFGLSPFGIWRPYNPPAIGGSFDQHNTLYADARKWLNEGWIDYYSPQLYWPINQLLQSYPVLLGWWNTENVKGRHLWPGISIGRQQGDKAADEAINEIMIARGMLPESPGVVHWSIGSLQYSPSLTKAISEGPYKRQALVPSSPWLDKKSPSPPEVNIIQEKDSMRISWSHKYPEDIAHWVVYYKYGSTWNHNIHGNRVLSDHVPGFLINRSFLTATDPLKINNIKDVLIPLDSIAVSAVDRSGNESAVIQKAV
jgi:hypothetical protein